MATLLLLEYPMALILVVTTFTLIILLWKLRNFINLYAEFPAYPVISKVVIASLLGKIPPHIPFHGFLFQTLMKASRQFQKEGLFFGWLFHPYLIIFGEEAVKTFSKEQEVIDKPYKYDVMRDVFGSGLLTSRSEDWRKQRKMLNPAFHLGMLKSNLSIFNRNAEILVKNLAELKDSSSIEVLEYIKPCAFGIICEYILGLKMNSRENKEIIENYTRLITAIGQMMVCRFCHPLFHFKFMMNFFPAGRTYLKQVNDLHSFTRKIISAMTDNIISKELDEINEEDGTENEKQRRKSFSQLLLKHHLENPTFTMDDLLYQVINFLAAGYETSAFTMMWCLFMLGHHPEVQDQAYNEIESISEDYIKYDDMIQLNYLDCVLKETLRLYPTVPVYGKRIGKDIQCGKYKVPKDTSIIFFPYELHRNPKMYPDPEKFHPERFMDGNIENLPWNFTPFAEGIRHCIGKRFAMMEMKVVLAHILRHFRITSLDRKEDVDLCWGIVLAPTKPLRFKLTPRK